MRLECAVTDRILKALLVGVLASAALYLARIFFEPIAFSLFGIALVWPFHKALETRLRKSAALGLTILFVLLVILSLAGAVVWSIDDVVHWTIVNLPRFQSMYSPIH
jgi:predicted PurR-regulated permease PerM